MSKNLVLCAALLALAIFIYVFGNPLPTTRDMSRSDLANVWDMVSSLRASPQDKPSQTEPSRVPVITVDESGGVLSVDGATPDPTFRPANIAQRPTVQIGGPSYQVLESNTERGGDGLPNRFFYTEEQARRLGLRKYTSGPCRNYYVGEEWWCK